MSKQNRKTLTEMSKAMKAGGVLIWIAPHGGRNIPNPTPGPNPDSQPHPNLTLTLT